MKKVVDGIEFESIRGHYFKGEIPGEMVTEWWTQDDWDKWSDHVEELKRTGEYGKKEEYEILLRPHPFFSNSEGLVIDINSIERHEFKPLVK